MKLKLVCQSCGISFERYPSHAKGGKGKFCSFACKWTRNAIRVEGGTGYIEIRNRAGIVVCEAAIDVADIPLVESYRWGAVWNQSAGDWRVRTTASEDGEHKSVLLHRFLLGLSPTQLVDHIDGDSLNNRRPNLRPANDSQNGQNRKGANKNSISGIRGVSRTRSGRWRARIMVNREGIYLGEYSTTKEAEAAVIAGRRKYMAYSND